MERMDIKPESSDDHQEVSIDNVAGHHENNKESPVQSTHSPIKHESASVPISTQSQPAQHSVGRCTKVKKEEEGGEIKLEWNGDECDCEECRTEREIKIEFNQNNTNIQQLVNSSGQSQANQSLCQHSVCKRVKKEEEHDEEWDEDCDCDQCRRMRLKAIPLGQTIKTVNQQTNSSELENDEKGEDRGDGDETEVDEERDPNVEDLEVGKDVQFAKDDQVGGKNSEDADYDELNHRGEHNEDSQESGDEQMSDASEDDETEIDDEEYKMGVDGVVDEQSDREPESQLPQNKKSPERKHVCEYCGKGLTKSNNMAAHIRTHIGGRQRYKCLWKSCNKTFAQKRYRDEHYKTHTGQVIKPHICEHCDIRCRSLSELTIHIRTHTGEKPYKCTWESCKKTFARKLHRDQHYKTHTGHVLQVPKPHKCEHCAKGFTALSHLTTHIRTHTGERPFKCPWKRCKLAFANKFNMTTHFKSHTGDAHRPHSCEHCAKRFATPSALTIHIRTHTGEKPFRCTWENCNKTFAEKCTMQRHFRNHTGEFPHGCKKCGKRFRSKFDLTVHIRKHNDEAFKCVSPNCGRGFMTLSKLKLHRTVHSDERYFACNCEGCTKKYKYKTDLVRHQKAKHKSP